MLVTYNDDQKGYPHPDHLRVHDISVLAFDRAGDPASLDLAYAVHRHLMRNLGIDDGEVRQGNYLVLRESTAPAVLGARGSSTHPKNIGLDHAISPSAWVTRQ